jgi:pyruvate kinase
MGVQSLTDSWPTIARPSTHDAPRRTRIVCTLGPATAEPSVVLALADAGMDCARLNFSHGTHEEHLARIAAVRSAEESLSRPISLLADLCGPKIRISRHVAPREVEEGDIVVFTGRYDPGSDVGVTFPQLAEVVESGHAVLIEDGRIRTEVIDRDGDRLRCVVRTAGTILPGKGVNVPDSTVPVPSLTQKDRDDLAFALAQGVDHVALSFVQRPEDVEELRELIQLAGSGARIIAKIEKAEAVAALDEITRAADGVMVARGDLGVEIGAAEVPLVQKRMIRRAAELGRTVITATQMLESMISSPEPTRAEASDVANAILDGTSAVMLSAETASGRYPLRAVETMDRISRRVEGELAPRTLESDGEVASVLTHTACLVAEQVDAAAIAVPTRSGQSAREVSRCRPARPILAATTSDVTLHQLALEWGVIPTSIPSELSIEESVVAIVDDLRARGLAVAGDAVVLTGRATSPLPDPTGSVLVHRLGGGG